MRYQEIALAALIYATSFVIGNALPHVSPFGPADAPDFDGISLTSSQPFGDQPAQATTGLIPSSPARDAVSLQEPQSVRPDPLIAEIILKLSELPIALPR